MLASSASQEELEALRSALDADDAIHGATSSTDADAGKPEPDIIEAALEQPKSDPERCVFVGDAVWDGQASARAGVVFVGCHCGGTSEAELRENGAVEVWRDPAALLADIDTSALARIARPAIRESFPR